MINRVATSLLSLLALFGPAASASAQPSKPNIIVIFADDLGYADVGCFGAKGFKTPNLDRMAEKGIRLTSFYTACSVCSGSRAALMTGRHYQRVGVPAVMYPSNRGLNPNEITIAALLRKLGYSCGIIGKWHLGNIPAYLPTKHGFQTYYGIPYSNDMTIDSVSAKFAKDVVFREGKTEEIVRGEKGIPGKVPLMRGELVIEYPVDQSTLTKRYTEEAVRFIQENKEKPFFLYLPHTMPHVPLFVSPNFKGRTQTRFGDVMEELDDSVGAVLKALKDNGIDEKTLVLFTSDNGAHQGSSLPLRGRKATMYEGGFRVPCIARWPGKIAASGVTDEMAATVDLLPTFAKLAGGAAPDDRPIDGKDIGPLLLTPQAKTPHEYYLFPHANGALRGGNWKFYPWPEVVDKNEKADPKKGMQLYDLATDLSETKNVAAMHPEVTQRLFAVYQRMTDDLKKNKLAEGSK